MHFCTILFQLTIFAFVLTCTDTLSLAIVLKAFQTTVDTVLVTFMTQRVQAPLCPCTEDGPISVESISVTTPATLSDYKTPMDADVLGQNVKLTYQHKLSAPTGTADADATIGGTPAMLYTVCLPFAPKTGDGVTYYTLSSVTGKTLTFNQVTTPAAFTPYLVAATSDITEECVGVVFKATDENLINTTVGEYTFKGTLTGLTNTAAVAAGGSNCTFILQSKGRWSKVTTEKTSAYIPPFKAYITGLFPTRIKLYKVP